MNIEQYQAQLSAIHCDLQRISLLQRKSRARVQIVHRHNSFYIRSINDKYKHIRILILSLIMHIYRQNHQHLLTHLKSIVYQSQLQMLTASHGLLKEELHKNVGVHLEQVQNGDDLQNQLIRCFNCVAFFDQVLVSSFAEYFNSNDFSSLHTWQQIVSKSFELEVGIVRRQQMGQCTNQHAEQINRDNFILLQMDGNSIYIPSSYRHSVETDRESDRSIVSIESVEFVQKNMKKNVLTVSIEDIESPYASNKQNVNNSNKQQGYHKISPFSHNSQPALKPLQRSRKKRNSLWSIFCCGTD